MRILFPKEILFVSYWHPNLIAILVAKLKKFFFSSVYECDGRGLDVTQGNDLFSFPRSTKEMLAALNYATQNTMCRYERGELRILTLSFSYPT